MASSTADYQEGYVRAYDSGEAVSPDGNPVPQCLGDASGPGDAIAVDELETAAEVRFMTETPVSENESGDLMDTDGPEFAAEVAFVNETQARELELIYNQQCFPGQMNVDVDPPSSDGLPKVPCPFEGQTSLVPQAVPLWGDGAGTGLDLLLDEIIAHAQQSNGHGSRNGARVGKGNRRNVHEGKHSEEISEAGPSNDSKKRRRGGRQ